MSETIVVPDNGNNMNNMLPWLASNGGFGGFGNTIGDLIGLAIVASIFGCGGNGFFGNGWGNNVVF